jgi:hypothetical protein
LPGLVSSDASGIRALFQDQKHIQEGLGSECRYRSQISRQCFAVSSVQRFYELLDRLICNSLDIFRIHFLCPFGVLKVGSFTQEQELNRNRFTGRTIFFWATTDGDERDRDAFFWRVRALVEAASSGMSA